MKRSFFRNLALLVLAFVSVSLVADNAYADFVNGSFETGNFSGWTVHDLGSPFFPLSVNTAGVSPGFGLFSSSPTNGSYAATTGFDGSGPGQITITQTVSVAATGTSTVTFDYRAGWDMLNFGGSTLSRLFDVLVLNASGSTVLLDQNFITAAAHSQTLDTGGLSGSLDVSAFAGQNVQIQFNWSVPQDFTGPAFSQLDNVHLVNTVAPVPEPSSLALAGLGGMSLIVRTIRRRRNLAA